MHSRCWAEQHFPPFLEVAVAQTPDSNYNGRTSTMHFSFKCTYQLLMGHAAYSSTFLALSSCRTTAQRCMGCAPTRSSTGLGNSHAVMCCRAPGPWGLAAGTAEVWHHSSLENILTLNQGTPIITEASSPSSCFFQLTSCSCGLFAPLPKCAVFVPGMVVLGVGIWSILLQARVKQPSSKQFRYN